MELPLLWVPGVVILPGIVTHVTIRGRGRGRAIWTAEEETGGRLLVAPGAYAPRKAEDLPAILCEASLTSSERGTLALRGTERVRVERVFRSGRGRRVQVFLFEEMRPSFTPDETESLRTAWRQLERLREAQLPYTNEVDDGDPEWLAWRAVSFLPSTMEQRLRVLAENDPSERLALVMALLHAEIDVALLERQILRE